MSEVLFYLSELGPYQLAGVLGFVVYLSAFGSVQLGLLDGNSVSYSLANVLAAALVAVSLITEFNLASALIQGSWIIIGLAGFALRTRRAWPQARRVLDTTLGAEVQQ